MERETKKLITKKSSVEVELKTYFTAGEKKAVDKVLYKDLKANPTDKDSSIFTSVSVEAMKEYEDEMVRQCIVSVVSNKENAYSLLLELHHKDYEEVLEVVRKVYADEPFLVEKTS